MWRFDRVQEQLDKEGRTRRWLAKFCGMEENIQQLNHYLSGRRIPKRPLVKLIAIALNTTEEYLMGEDENVDTPSGKRAVS